MRDELFDWNLPPERKGYAASDNLAQRRAAVASTPPPMPGEPAGIPGTAIPVISGRCSRSCLMAAKGPWPSTI